MTSGIKLIDLIRGTDILGKYRLLVDLWNRGESLEDMALGNLSRYLLTIREKNKYYKPFLQEFSPEEIKRAPFEVLKSLPVSDKKILSKKHDLIFTPVKGIGYQKKRTGGSTGEPFHYLVDKEHVSWMWAHNYLFWHINSGYQPGDPFVTIAGNSLRTVNRQFTENIYYRLQNNYFLKGDMIGSRLKLNAQRLNKAVLIYGYPSSIQNILRVIPDFSEKFKNLKAIFTTSEQLLPGVRNFIEKEFNKPVFDLYGAYDGGIMSCECKAHNGYHYNFLNCFVETQETDNGLTELLLTNTNSLNFPFIRYRVGDIGNITKSICECGSSWPRITDLKGRTRDVIKLQDGSAIHGSVFNKILYHFPEIHAYRIVQDPDYSVFIHIYTENAENFGKNADELAKTVKKHIPGLAFKIIQMQDYNPTNLKFKLIESHVI